MNGIIELASAWVDWWSAAYASLPKLAQEAPIWSFAWLVGSAFLFGIAESVATRVGVDLDDHERYRGASALIVCGPALISSVGAVLLFGLFLAPVLVPVALAYTFVAYVLFLFGPYGSTEFWGRYQELTRKEQIMMLALIPFLVFAIRGFRQAIRDIEDDVS